MKRTRRGTTKDNSEAVTTAAAITTTTTRTLNKSVAVGDAATTTTTTTTATKTPNNNKSKSSNVELNVTPDEGIVDTEQLEVEKIKEFLSSAAATNQPNDKDGASTKHPTSASLLTQSLSNDVLSALHWTGMAMRDWRGASQAWKILDDYEADIRMTNHFLLEDNFCYVAQDDLILPPTSLDQNDIIRIIVNSSADLQTVKQAAAHKFKLNLIDSTSISIETIAKNDTLQILHFGVRVVPGDEARGES